MFLIHRELNKTGTRGRQRGRRASSLSPDHELLSNG